MTLIERINSFINAVASDIKSLYANKVNKTDVIAVAQGGTGAKDVETARSNLGLGTAATKNVGTGAGNVMEVGAFGLGAGSIITNFDVISENGFSHFSSGWNSDFIYRATITVTHSSQPHLYAWQMGVPMGDLDARDLGVRVRSGGVWSSIATIYNSHNTPNINVKFGSISSGQASYKKGWRKLTATLPSQAGEIIVAHGVTTVETVQAKVANTDGIIIYNNDIDPTNQFYVRVNGANLILGVTANSTKVFFLSRLCGGECLHPFGHSVSCFLSRLCGGEWHLLR